MKIELGSLFFMKIMSHRINVNDHFQYFQSKNTILNIFVRQILFGNLNKKNNC